MSGSGGIPCLLSRPAAQVSGGLAVIAYNAQENAYTDHLVQHGRGGGFKGERSKIIPDLDELSGIG
jgi:hypothetical protein